MMLVSGYAGIGKSALVQELYKPLTAKRGYFIWGKFDQFGRNILQRDCRCPEKMVQLLGEADECNSGDRACLRHWEATDKSSLMSSLKLS